jgi:hypothetical protein
MTVSSSVSRRKKKRLPLKQRRFSLLPHRPAPPLPQRPPARPAPPRRPPRSQPISTRVSLFECFSLCLSRACLGKMIICTIQWHRKKTRFPFYLAALRPRCTLVLTAIELTEMLQPAEQQPPAEQSSTISTPYGTASRYSQHAADSTRQAAGGKPIISQQPAASATPAPAPDQARPAASSQQAPQSHTQPNESESLVRTAAPRPALPLAPHRSPPNSPLHA